jgi:hypothetical protein
VYTTYPDLARDPTACGLVNNISHVEFKLFDADLLFKEYEFGQAYDVMKVSDMFQVLLPLYAHGVDSIRLGT